MIIIPLSQNYSSLFDIELNLEIYDFRILYNSRFKNWSFDILKNDIEIISGVSMVLGSDIIAQFNLGLDSLFMVDLDQTNIDASAFDIGSRVVLVKATQEEIDNATSI